MSGPIVIAGSPTSLGGHFDGMERTPAELRALGIVDRLRERPGFAAATFTDIGDAPNDPGWARDDDRRAKNRSRICTYLPRLAGHVRDGLVAAGEDARLLVLGGDCTSHAGAMAGLRRARPGARFGIAWFDAHGDFNTPDTTPSGNVWGMPFAMIVGHGSEDLLAAADAPTADAGDAALLGGQVLDETESRMLAASRVAHFGAGMLGTDAGMAALQGWARVVAERVDGFYVAFDMDALDAAGDWALAMPEPNGLSLETAVTAVETIAAAGPVVGFGATAILIGRGGDPERTAAAVATLAEAALGEGA
ncbi:MAG TPA: arginase family protein [Candidatus Limnocylindrales bacterium]|nr:arginase family protein [Candidatus Limnocylindrales bacterium]